MLTLYTQPGCPHCVTAETWLENHDIPYEVVNIRESSEALDFIVSRGHKTVPQIYSGETLVVTGGASGLRALTEEQIEDLKGVLV